MSEDEARRIGAQDDDSDEVEAHRRVAGQNEDADEEDEDDEVEGHARRIG